MLENICFSYHVGEMQWTVLFDTAFEREFMGLAEEVQDKLLAHAKLLGAFGPRLGRPRADTLNGSKRVNMKGLRFGAAAGVWRVAFAFDLERRASWRKIRRGSVRNVFTSSSSRRQMNGSTNT